MYFLFLLPVLALAGIGILVRRRAELWGNILIGVACAGCVGLIVWQARETVFAGDNRIPPQDAIALNSVLTGVVQQELRGRGGAVLLVFPDEKVLKEEALENYRNSFRGIFLRGHPELSVETARLKPAAKGASPTAAELKTLISQTPKVIAVVSYAGVASDIDQAFAVGAAGDPLFFVFDPQGTTSWLGALKRGVVRCVIVPRPDVDPAAQAGMAGMPAENFGKLYMMATPGNADQIAARLGGK